MYTLVTVVTLGLGIGANTAIFSVVNGVILRPLPYPKPEQLTFLTTRFPAFGFDQFWVSPPEYFEFRELNKSFSAVGAFTTGEANLSAGDRPRRVRTANVDDHLLTALGIQPAAGRLFRGSETVVVGPPPGPGAPPLPLPPYTILSYELWQAAFGGRDMIGQTVEVNGLAREVIGIMPPGADVMDNRTEMWFPLGLNPGVRTNRGSHFLYLIGRLKEDVTPQQAQTELASLLGNWGERVGLKQGHVFRSLAPGVDPKTNPGAGHILQMEPMREELIGSASRAIWVLQAAVGFVLLIACANLANLLLARAETRHREFAVRTALGAGRWHLVRQFMAEGLLLSIAGGALGLVVARLGVQALVRMYPTTLPRTSELGIDPIVLLFTVAVSMATGLLFGLAPLMHTRASGLLSALKEGGAKGATGGPRPHPQRARRGGGRARRDARDRREPAAAHGLESHADRRRLRSLASRDVHDGAASGQVSAAAGARAVVSAAPRAAARDSRRAGGDRHVRAAAQPSAQRQRHRDRQLHRAPGRPVRERRLLPERDDGVLRDHGHPHRPGTSVSGERCDVDRPRRHRQRDAREHVLEEPESDRAAAASVLRRPALVHGRGRGEGRQAGRRRSEDRDRVLLPDRSDGQPGAVRASAWHAERRAPHDAAGRRASVGDRACRARGRCIGAHRPPAET